MSTSKFPKISVIVPYYNPHPSLFEDAINSIFAQSYDNWEAIIVNDGSIQANTEVLQKYIRGLNDSRCSIINLDKNYGPSVARNKGIEAAKGEIITFLDTDDLHFPWYYQQISDHFFNHPNDLIIATPSYKHINSKNNKGIFLGSFEYKLVHDPTKVAFRPLQFPQILSEDDSKILSFLAHRIALKLFINGTPRIAVKKEVFNFIQFDEHFRTAEDSDLCLQILNNEDLLDKTKISTNPYYLYRIYSSRNRLTLNAKVVFQNMGKLKTKYSDKKSIASKSLWFLQRRDEWKLNVIIYRHLCGQSPFKTLKDIFNSSKSLKGKFQNIVDVLKLIFKYQLITECLGKDIKESEIVKNGHLNKTSELQVLFKEHLDRLTDKSSKPYAIKMYEAIF
ncbi:MAG: glycosyltransferase family 2 protein [Candidatus Melainabacteria bacterium]|nr:glycosyltransferase family 2 protein [Candidatus Melainabacteria bacterium]MBI3308720.1 glycosyltransferase family 2 protein [Candidatus Melainabacteria bacterium]